jgi:hypothetical protein
MFYAFDVLVHRGEDVMKCAKVRWYGSGPWGAGLCLLPRIGSPTHWAFIGNALVTTSHSSTILRRAITVRQNFISGMTQN